MESSWLSLILLLVVPWDGEASKPFIIETANAKQPWPLVINTWSFTNATEKGKYKKLCTKHHSCKNTVL